MTLLKLFCSWIFFCVLKKNPGALGNLGEDRLADSTHTARIKNFGPQKIFRYTIMTLLNFLYFMNFSSCQFKKWTTGKLRLSYVSHYYSHGWYWNYFFRYTFKTLPKLFDLMTFSSCPFKKRSTGKLRLS